MTSDRERLRRQARRRRRDAAAAAHDAAASLAERFLDAVPWTPDHLVAGYWPQGTEIDVRPLLARLASAGCQLALPCVDAPDRPLRFRRWQEGDTLTEGPFAISQPARAAPPVRPDLVLVPLLAVDETGHRLGSGHGYYDRTLEALRRDGSVVAVGVAYHAQRVDRLPALATDERLDWLVTERGAESFV